MTTRIFEHAFGSNIFIDSTIIFAEVGKSVAEMVCNMGDPSPKLSVKGII